MSGRSIGVVALVVACGLVAVLAAGSGFAAGPKPPPPPPCSPKVVAVTDPGDSGDTTTPGQLRTAVAQVCPGGRVEVGPTVGDISLGGSITVDKAVKVSGHGQTIHVSSYGFDVTTSGSLDLTGITLSGDGVAVRGISVEGALTLHKVTVTGFRETAIVASSGSSVTLAEGTLITGNKVDRAFPGGAGIYNDGGSVMLTHDAAVTDNTNKGCYMTPAPRPTNLAFGGGIFNRDGSVTLRDHAVVSGNVVLFCDPTKSGYGGAGGGIFSEGGSVALSGHARVSGNAAGSGGGIDVYVGTVGLTLEDHAAVTGNTATAGGGGIVTMGTPVTLSGSSTISGNVAGGHGGGIADSLEPALVTLNDKALIAGNTAGAPGGGVYGCTVVLNQRAAVTGNTPDDVYP